MLAIFLHALSCMRRRQPRLLSAVVCSMAMTTPPASATVATANGNYFIGFTDLELTDDAGVVLLAISRTYNSRSQFRGSLGYAWGSDLDTFLIPSADGSVVIQEVGGGSITRFERPGSSPMELDLLINRILDAKRAAAKGVDFDEAAFRAQLVASAYFRDQEARDLDLVRELPLGAELRSSDGLQSVTRTEAGYVRDDGVGTIEYFETKGSVFDQGIDSDQMRRLSGVYKPTRRILGHSAIDAAYSYATDNGQLSKISLDSGRFLAFEHNQDGFITRITDEKGSAATYEYCASVKYDEALRCQKSDLVVTTDTSGSRYTFAYDQLHNLTEIGLLDGTEEIAYYPSTLDSGGVTSVTATSGLRTFYDYWVDPATSLHYRTTKLTKYASGETYRVRYEYWDKTREGGETYLYKLRTTGSDGFSETIYNECCGDPVFVRDETGITEYDYYEGTNLPKERRGPVETVRWEYSSDFVGRITRYETLDSETEQVTQGYRYKYDADRRLTRAESDMGKWVELSYDASGRIASFKDDEGRNVTFDYSNQSKPKTITVEGLGRISVTYTPKGEIDEVSSEDSEVATSVVAALLNLLKLIEPSGIKAL